MSHIERIFQTILYEVLAIALSFGLIKFFPSEQPPTSIKALAVFAGISVIAMVWSYVYNLIFDQVFIGDKLTRPLWLRILHIMLFELGLLCATLPILMWLLQIGIWQAVMMDIGLTLLIMGYSVVFYWGYDWMRAKMVIKSK